MSAAGNERNEWGRVDDDGTVFVRIGDTEHAVGQYPEGSPQEALAFFTRRYDGVAFEVRLLEQRIRKGALSPEEARKSLETVEAQLAEPNFVGDVIGLRARLEALRPVISQQREQRRADRARRAEGSRTRKQEIAEAAEQVAAGNDWRNGANRLRELLDEWKALPRVDKGSDDALWHRFSGARTAYTKARKAHFARMAEQREDARAVKERLVVEAEEIADSTDWGATAGRYRSMMQQWKAAGPAPREVDEQLWRRFRGAQDTFFGARDAANAEQDRELQGSAEKKRVLLAQAQALLPIGDLAAAKRSFRDISERWDAAGKVPRDQVRQLEGAMRKVEQAIRGAEDASWRRTDPEKSARADDMVSKLAKAVAEVEQQLADARAAGDEKRAAELESDLSSRRSMLEMAKKAASEFSG
ncbi:MAG: DUF349 domain-containing protein [Marmoricola sp.]